MARVKNKVQYVFIHPSWRGGWCWDKVIAVMKAWGREAYAPDGWPQQAQTKPPGQRSRTSAARHCSSVPKASRNASSLRPRTRDATLNPITVHSEHIEAECHG